MLVGGMDKEWSPFQTELALHQGYSMLLMGELRATHLPVPATLEIPSLGPIIPPFKHRYMPVPLGSSGS